MVKEIKNGEVKKLFPKRDVQSHKGMNGLVMIVGGSKEFYGAPILSALGALYGGADLVYVFVPDCNFEVSRSMYPDLIVRSYPGDYLDLKAVTPILDFARKCDSILIGPGLGERESTMEALLRIVKGLDMPTVLDAGAIQVFQKIREVLRQQIVLTPHHNEFETLTGKDIKVSGSLSNKVVLLRTLATDLKINILLKGPQDVMASQEGEVVSNSTGNAGMTVGGSGDVLTGVIAALLGQRFSLWDAARFGVYFHGLAGDLAARKVGEVGLIAGDILHWLRARTLLG